MANNVYLACYHGRADKFLHRLCDGITKFFTRGKYSHCEIAVQIGDKYLCYSSSVRDGGVRVKTMVLPSDKWDLIDLDGLPAREVRHYFRHTQGADYDLFGALGCVVGIRQNPDKFYCSEWCYNAIFGSNQGFRFSPVQLAEITSHISRLDD